MLEQIAELAETFEFTPEPKATGRLSRVVGLTIEAVGLRASVGSRCLIEHPDHKPVEAEVVGFDDDRSYLVALAGQHQLYPGSRVRPLESSGRLAVGPELLGRVLSALAEPLDDLGIVQTNQSVKFNAPSINPMRRQPIEQALDVGVRAINSLLTLGKGQRIGLFAGSGVGKSTLLGMITRYTAADVVVVGLVGERGREVREFIDQNMDDSTRKKAIVIASPADETPLMRIRAANVATRIAEHFRDQGKQVLLLMDSLSRFAQAHREVALAAGEPPASRGYPASVFAKIPALVERAGNGDTGGGSLTAIYTVLTDGDELQDPIADAARAILDGHIVLSRELADAGHFPAIDVGASVSRVMTAICSDEQLQHAMRFKQWNAAYNEVRDLLSIGAYQQGADAMTDGAIAKWPFMQAFLQQSVSLQSNMQKSGEALAALNKETASEQAMTMVAPDKTSLSAVSA